MIGRPCFELTFSDGASIVADAEHQWLTTTLLEGGRHRREGVSPFSGRHRRFVSEMSARHRSDSTRR